MNERPDTLLEAAAQLRAAVQELLNLVLDDLVKVGRKLRLWP